MSRTLLLTCAVVASIAASHAGQTTPRLEHDVRAALANEEDLTSIAVSVFGANVTLTGRVPTFWAKSQAIERTLDIHGVDTVISEIEIPAVEDDRALAEKVGQSVATYPYYTMFDYVDGRVDNGNVQLGGSVTPDLDKRGDIFERVAKIRGVQDVQSTIEILPSSVGDANLRRTLAARIFNNDFFTHYARLRVPPFHVIVQGARVTLKGVVRDRVEKRVLEQAVRGTFGLVSVTNELQPKR